MTEEHKHYAEALILASKIYAEFERTTTTTKYKVDESKIFYRLEEHRLCSLRKSREVLRLDLEKGNRATFARIILSHRPKHGTDEIKISVAFKSYLNWNCPTCGSMKKLLSILPSHRHVIITDILADLD